MDAALMNVELGRLPDGGIVLCANPEFPEQVKRVEYYRDQKLFMLIYEDIDHEGELMHFTNELRFFQMERLPSGKLKYGAADGYNDDCVIAVGLANYAYKNGMASEWKVKNIGDFYEFDNEKNYFDSPNGTF